MAWQDRLIELRDELAEVRGKRQRQAVVDEHELQQARQGLLALAGSLGISEMLADMNATLLRRQGELETIVSWESVEDNPGPQDGPGLDEVEDEEEDDAVTTVLSWEEAGEREIAVDLVLTQERPSLQVNGVEVRQERAALEQALLEAFRDELEL